MGNFFKSKFPYLLKCRLPKQGNGSVKLSSKVSIPTQMWASETSPRAPLVKNLKVSIPAQMRASETRWQQAERGNGLFPYPLKCGLLKQNKKRNLKKNKKFPYPLKCRFLKLKLFSYEDFRFSFHTHSNAGGKPRQIYTIFDRICKDLKLILLLPVNQSIIDYAGKSFRR